MEQRLLYLLVEALNKSEIRNFINGRKTNGEELFLYERIFLIITSERVGSDVMLLELAKPWLRPENLQYQKKYLYDKICDFLINTYGGQHVFHLCSRQLSLAHSLFSKNLFGQAQKVLKRVELMAMKWELFPILMEIHSLTMEHSFLFMGKVKFARIEEITSNSLAFFNSLDLYNKLQTRVLEVITLRRKSHDLLDLKDSDFLTKLLEDPILDCQAEVSFKTITNQQLLIKSTACFLLQNPEAYKYATQALDNWLAQEILRNNNQGLFLETLFVYYYSAIKVNKINRIPEIFSNSAAYGLVLPAYRSHYEALRFLALNRFYNISRNYDAVTPLIEHIEVKFKEWEPFLNIEMARTVLMSAGIACFVLERYQQAFYLIKQGLALFNDSSRPEHYSFAYLFLVVIQFETSNDFLFDLEFKKSQQYFYRKKTKISFEIEFLNKLNKLFYVNQNMGRAEILTDFSSFLKHSSKSKSVQATFSFFNFPRWVLCKQQQLRYRDWVGD